MDLRIFGQDLGKCWGWATILQSDSDAIPEIDFGEEEAGNDALTNASAGMIYYTYRRWLQGFLEDVHPTLAVYESVRFTRGMSYIEGQKGILLSELELRGIPYYGLPIGTLKKWATGSGKADKKEVMRAVRDRWGPGFSQLGPWDNRKKLTDNMADALWCAHHGWSTAS